MSNYATATGQGEVVFVAIQPEKDVMQFPTSSGTVFVTEPPTFSQEPVYAKNEEMGDGYAEKKGRIAGFKMGSLKIASNFKCSGTPGALSPLHPLLLSAYGRHTVTGNTRVEYKHYRRSPVVDPFIYLTVLVKQQTKTVLMTNVRVKKIDIDISRDKILTIPFDCMFEFMSVAGKSALKIAIDGTSAPVKVIPLNSLQDYQLFTTGCYIYVGTDTNSGAGFKVTEVSKEDNTLTIEGGVTTAQAQGAIIAGYVPTAVAAGENIVTSKTWKTQVTGENGAEKVYCTNIKFSVENGTKPLENIMSDTDVKGFAEGSRKVSLTSTSYYALSGDVADYLLRNAIDIPVTVQIGTESGCIVKIVAPCWSLEKATESGKEEKSMQRDGRCYEDTGDDESTLVLE